MCANRFPEILFWKSVAHRKTAVRLYRDLYGKRNFDALFYVWKRIVLFHMIPEIPKKTFAIYLSTFQLYAVQMHKNSSSKTKKRKHRLYIEPDRPFPVGSLVWPSPALRFRNEWDRQKGRYERVPETTAKAGLSGLGLKESTTARRSWTI